MTLKQRVVNSYNGQLAYYGHKSPLYLLKGLVLLALDEDRRLDVQVVSVVAHG